MVDLKAVARVVRWASESLVLNLEQISEEKLDWKPTPEAKSALQIAGEVAGVMRNQMHVFSGATFVSDPLPHPATLDEARTMIRETAEQYASALDAAGDELERPISTPFGEFWAAHSVLFGMIDLVHHHGQIMYIQSLLGDAEMHYDPESIKRWFAPPSTQ